MVVVGVFLEGGGQSAAETGEVGASLDRVDVVDVGEDVLVEREVVGHRHLHGDAVALRGDVYYVLDEVFLALVDVADEVLEAVVGMETVGPRVALLVALTLVGERERYSGVEVCEVAQAVGQRLVVVYGLGENRCVGVEYDGGPGVVCVAYGCEAARGLSEGVFLHMDPAVAVNLGSEEVAERVDA